MRNQHPHRHQQQLYAVPLRAVASKSGDTTDVARLLAETDELLGAVDPTVFLFTASVPPPEGPLSEFSSDAYPRVTIPQRSSSSPSSNDSGSKSNVAAQIHNTHYELVTSSANAAANAVVARKRAVGRPVTKPGAGRNLSRERMQRELADLREQVAYLTAELAVEQGKSKRGNAAVLALMGRRTAKRQKELRERAETENKHLKAQFEAQHVFMTEMRRTLLSWQQAMAHHPADPRHGIVPYTSVSLSPGDATHFELLLSEIDAAYARMHGVLHVAGLDRMETAPFSSTKQRKQVVHDDGSLSSFLEFVSVGVSPFSFEASKKVTWPCIKQYHLNRLNCIRYPLPGDQDAETFAVKYHVKQARGGRDESFDSLFVIRQYETSTTDCWVWRGISTSEQYSEDVYVEETGWLEMSELAVAGTCVAGTLLTSCVQYETKHVNASQNLRATTQPDASVVTSMVLSSYEDDLVVMNDMLENMLLIDSETKKKTESASCRTE